jgi:hypothetical protein
MRNVKEFKRDTNSRKHSPTLKKGNKRGVEQLGLGSKSVPNSVLSGGLLSKLTPLIFIYTCLI